jgi:hypothetical protein
MSAGAFLSDKTLVPGLKPVKGHEDVRAIGCEAEAVPIFLEMEDFIFGSDGVDSIGLPCHGALISVRACNRKTWFPATIISELNAFT